MAEQSLCSIMLIGSSTAMLVQLCAGIGSLPKQRPHCCLRGLVMHLWLACYSAEGADRVVAC